MRTRLDKSCAILILALAVLAAGSGCTVATPLPAKDDSCPAALRREADFNREDHAIVRVPVDHRGLLYPDPLRHRLDRDRLVKAKGSVAAYWGEDYDPEATADEYARRIRKYLDAGYLPFLLIHGFNATLEEIYRSYKGVQREVEHCYPGVRIVYVEIYWQGYYGSPYLIWHKAQDSSKWAGLGLRRILGRLRSETPVRVLTHSRGAAVICSALWNTGTRNVEAVEEFQAAQKATPPPVLPNLRVAMVAPAMRVEEFETYDQRGEAAFYYHDRIILGLNPDDYALKCGGFDGMMGTTLGCTPSEFDRVVGPLLNRGRSHAFLVDFSGSTDHNFTDYVLRDVFETEFLPRLMGGVDDRLVTGSGK